MKDIVISAQGLGKTFRLRERGTETLKGALQNLGKRITGGGKDGPGKVIALEDVSFQVERGEIVGIIGPNGSGKSTLLKILSKISRPDLGEVVLRGKVASLLEVGTGFHPDLSGRENIRMNGIILGMSRSEVEERMQEIIDFSGVADFIDSPVKSYSSGMVLRLAFSVITILDADILLLDEVLAVGDQAFRMKSSNKIKELTGKGRTVLFVSHNLNVIGNLCTRCIRMEKGRIAAEGRTKLVLADYLEAQIARQSDKITLGNDAKESVNQGKSNLETREWKNSNIERSNNKVSFSRVEIHPKNPEEKIFTDSPVEIRIHYQVWNQNCVPDFAFRLADQFGNTVFAHSTLLFGLELPGGKTSAPQQISATIPPNLLNRGYFTLSFSALANGELQADQYVDILRFYVHWTEKEQKSKYDIPGPVNPKLSWKKLESPDETQD